MHATTSSRIPRIGAHVSVAGGTLDDHPRLKVCFDTCHAMCAGYDLHDPATATATADELDKHLPGRIALVHTTSG